MFATGCQLLVKGCQIVVMGWQTMVINCFYGNNTIVNISDRIVSFCDWMADHGERMVSSVGLTLFYAGSMEL